VNNLSADNERIYVTGMSSGGFMAAKLGCELSDRIAAVAIVAATVEQKVFTDCRPNRLVPAMIIQGTADPFVPFAGGVVLPGAGGVAVSHEQAIAKWVSINNCNATPTVTNIPNNANDGTTITRSEYSNVSNTAAVIGFVVNNGGHTWPQGLQYQSVSVIGKTSQNMNANQEIWLFVKKYERG